MTKRIFSGIILVSLVIMLSCVGLIMGVMYGYLGQQIDKELTNEAVLVKTAMEQNPDFLGQVKKDGDIRSRITLIDTQGEVLFDSLANPSEMANHGDREEVKEAAADGEGFAVRTSATSAKSTRYYAVKLEDGNILRLSTAHYSQLGLILDTFGMVVVIVAILIGLGAIISHNITRHILKPINDIDLNNPDINESYEELAPLLHRIHQQNNKIRHQIENLRSKQEEFNIITENMSEGLLIIGKDMEVLTFNKSALKILNAENRPLNESALALNRSEPFRTAVEEALGGENSRHQLEMGQSTYEIIASPVINESSVTGAIIILMDVTEKEVGERLRREFTSNVSHELKTPLTSIYGVSDMLAGGLVKAEDVKDFARTIKEESHRLIALIDDILELSKLDENYGVKEKEAVDLYQVAGDVVQRLSSKAAGAGIELSLKGESAVIDGVEYILEEVIYNLCDNAIKYNRPGGSVTVFAGRELGRSVVRVADTGIGIPSGDLDRVFERFYRVDKSHSKAIGGTGLGLSIVKHGVAYHDGTISIESSEGVGTTVTVRF